MCSSSLEKPEGSQHSTSPSSLEPFTSTLRTYLKEKKITQKHKHTTGDRAPSSNPNTLLLSPALLSLWGPGKALHGLAARVAAWTGPSFQGSAQGSHAAYSAAHRLPRGFCSPWFSADVGSSQRRNDTCLASPPPFCCSLFLPVPELLSRHHPPLPSPSLSSCFPVRFPPPYPALPFLSESHLDTTSSSISLYAFSELGVALPATSTHRLALIATGSRSAQRHRSSLPALPGHLGESTFFPKPAPQLTEPFQPPNSWLQKGPWKRFSFLQNLIARYPDLFPGLSLSRARFPVETECRWWEINPTLQGFLLGNIMSHAASRKSVTATLPHARKKHGLALIPPPCHHPCARTPQGWKRVNQMMLHKVCQFLYKQY